MTIHPRRSALYVPGSNERAMEKARTLAADAIIFDLEDAVGPDEKATARVRMAAAVASGGYVDRELVVRINGLASPWGLQDIAAAVAAQPHALLVPKVQSPEQLAAAAKAITEAGGNCTIWAMIETPRAIIDLPAIARCAEDPQIPLTCFVIGTNDLAKDTRSYMDQNRSAALFWLSSIVTAARAFGLDVLDGVYNNFRDLDGLAVECRQGKMFGMDGKTLIHPSQIDTANTIFTPTPEEVVQARKILAAFDLPENQGKGVISLDGEMVELLHTEIARRTVTIADKLGV